jgi:hypothetical protein
MVAQAVDETITTPTPGVGHGRLGDREHPARQF